MHKVIAAFSFIVASMWIVIAIAELSGPGGPLVAIVSAVLAATFLFAGWRLLTKPPERFRR